MVVLLILELLSLLLNHTRLELWTLHRPCSAQSAASDLRFTHGALELQIRARNLHKDGRASIAMNLQILNELAMIASA